MKTLEIINTEHNVEDYNENDGAYSLVSWLKIAAKYKGNDIEFTMQHDCGTSFDLFDVDDLGDDFHYLVSETDCFDDLKQGDSSYIENLRLEKFQDSEDYDEVLELAKKVNKIMNDKADYLMLCKVFFEAKSIDIGHAMCSLQIACDMTQDQSRRVVELF